MKIKFYKKFSSGFTLIELLITMAIIGLLATTLIVAINPARQFAKARDTQRTTDLYAILSAIYQYNSEHSGGLPTLGATQFPTTRTCIGSAAGCFNLAGAGDGQGNTIVPTYMAQMPQDPKTGSQSNTGYFVYVDTNGRLVASASGEVTPNIGITK